MSQKQSEEASWFMRVGKSIRDRFSLVSPLKHILSLICTSQANSKCWQVHKIQILRIWLNFLFWKRNFSYFHHVQRLPVFISIFLSMEPSLEVWEEARLDERLVYPVFTGQFFCCYQVINNVEETFHLFIARSQYSSSMYT